MHTVVAGDVVGRAETSERTTAFLWLSRIRARDLALATGQLQDNVVVDQRFDIFTLMLFPPSSHTPSLIHMRSY